MSCQLHATAHCDCDGVPEHSLQLLARALLCKQLLCHQLSWRRSCSSWCVRNQPVAAGGTCDLLSDESQQSMASRRDDQMPPCKQCTLAVSSIQATDALRCYTNDLQIVQHASYRQVWIANDAGSARIPASSATSAMTHLLCCECDLLLCGCMLPVAATGLHFLACCPAVTCCLLLVGRLIQLCLGFVPGAAALGCAWLGYNHCCYSWPQAVLASCRHTPQPCSIWSSQSL